MSKRSFMAGGLMTLAATALMLAPNVSQAQHHGGGWGGHSGYYGGQGGYYGGHSGWGGSYGHSGWGGYGHGWGYAPSWGGYYGGYSPSYGYSNWYTPGYYSGYSNYAPNWSYGYSTPQYLGDEYTSGNNYLYGATGNYYGSQENPNAAQVQVQVPANAEIWFEGEKTSQTGTMRRFVSPELTPGKTYVYDIRARWNENGRDVTRDKKVNVRAGEQVSVDFGQATTQTTDQPTDQPATGTRTYGTSPADRDRLNDRTLPPDRNDLPGTTPTIRTPPDRARPAERNDLPGATPADRTPGTTPTQPRDGSNPPPRPPQ